MEVVYIIAGLAIGLLIAEMLLPTGGGLAVVGAAGLVAAGVIALGDDSDNADYIGSGLITLGVLSLVTSVLIGRKVVRAHQEGVRTGWEELIGRAAEVRAPLDPEGQIWIEGALWKARVADGEPNIPIGNSVRIESVDGLTLIVKPLASTPTQTSDKES